MEPGFPRKLSFETSRKWLHELGFVVVTKKKGTFVDGHELDDVIESRRQFLRRMIGLGFLHENNAPTDDAKVALNSVNLEPPSQAKPSYCSTMSQPFKLMMIKQNYGPLREPLLYGQSRRAVE